jgi:hypothetical protein
VITLRRENLLARYVSELVAHLRNRWLVRVGERVPLPVQVAIRREHMLEDFARTEALMEIARRRFPSALDVSISNFGEVRAWLADTHFEAFLEMS